MPSFSASVPSGWCTKLNSDSLVDEASTLPTVTTSQPPAAFPPNGKDEVESGRTVKRLSQHFIKVVQPCLPSEFGFPLKPSINVSRKWVNGSFVILAFFLFKSSELRTIFNCIHLTSHSLPSSWTLPPPTTIFPPFPSPSPQSRWKPSWVSPNPCTSSL